MKRYVANEWQNPLRRSDDDDWQVEWWSLALEMFESGIVGDDSQGDSFGKGSKQWTSNEKKEE